MSRRIREQRVLCRHCKVRIAVVRRRLIGRRVEPTERGEIARADNAEATVRCKACGATEQVSLT